MEIREGGKGGFAGDSPAVHEAEVGVVQEDEDGFSRFGGPVDGVYNGFGFGDGGGVAGGVVGEVEQEDFFVAVEAVGAFGARGTQGPGEAFDVEGGVRGLGGECGEGFQDGAAGFGEDEAVVAPVGFGEDDFIPLIHEEIAGGGEAVGEGVGNHRAGDELIPEAGVLSANEAGPCVPQFGFAEARGVAEGVGGIDGDTLGDGAEAQGRAVVFPGFADGGVDGFAFGIEALGHEAFSREEDASAPGGEEFEGGGAFGLENGVEFGCLGVHGSVLMYGWPRLRKPAGFRAL